MRSGIAWTLTLATSVGRERKSRIGEIASRKRFNNERINEMSDERQETIADIVREINREFGKLRAENARLCAALKPVLECKVMSAMTAEIEPGKSEYCAAIIEKAQRIYSEGEERGGVDVFDVP